MASQAGINVLRWSALGFGVAYGIYRQTTISAADRLHEQQAEWKRKETLIERAKQEYQNQKFPQNKSKGKDLNDPNVDIDTLITFGGEK